ERDGPFARRPERTAPLGTREVGPSVGHSYGSVAEVLAVEGAGELAGEGADRPLDLLPPVHVAREGVVGRAGPGLLRRFGLRPGLAAREGDQLPRERAEGAGELGGLSPGQVPDRLD